MLNQNGDLLEVAKHSLMEPAQRVASVRALFSDTPIHLLDEATRAMDEKTEAKLFEYIGSMRDKTVIIMTDE